MTMLINPYRLAAGGGSGWQPSSLASLKGWWVADDIAGADGAFVGSWTDRVASLVASGGQNDATPSPYIRVAQLNGLRTLRFDSPNSSGQSLNFGTTFMASETAGAMFYVTKTITDPPAGTVDAGAPVDGLRSATQAAHHPFTDGKIYENFGSSARKDCGNPTPSLTAWRLFSAHSGSGDFRAYLDATLLFSTATNTVGFGSATRRFGTNTAGNGWDGEVAEILIFNDALTTGDRQKVEGYLAWKYGLQAQLPGAHPYLSAAP